MSDFPARAPRLGRRPSTSLRPALIFVIVVLGIAGLSGSRAAAETFRDRGLVSEVVVTLEPYTPIGIAFAPDGRMFIWEKAGIVRVFRPGANGNPGELLPTPFIDIQSQVNQYHDRGLLGLALDPGFPRNGYVYLLYTYQDGGDPFDPGPKTARLIRVRADPAAPDTALPGSEEILLGSTDGTPCNDLPAGADCIPSDGPGHTIAGLRFGRDGKLYVGIGDGGTPNYVDPNAWRAQRLDSYAGKLLRINPDGTAPGDNPFDDGTDSIQSRVYAFGLRNPYRFAMAANGDVYIGDVGWNDFEEINRGRGANFGWPCFEGDAPQPQYQEELPECQGVSPADVVPPLHAYGHDDGITVIAGPVYTASAYPQQYRNNLFFADYGAGWIRRMVLGANGSAQAIQEFGTGLEGIVHLELGPDGLLYYVNIVTGEVRRIRIGPTAVARASRGWGYAPLAVRFFSEGSRDSANGGLTYSWDFGDGSPPSTHSSPTHVFTASEATAYTVTLTVTVTRGPNTGMTSSATTRVVVNSRPPVPLILSPVNRATVAVGQTVDYGGTATDADNEPVDLNWTVLLHHNDHVHTLAAAGGPGGSFVVEDHGQGRYSYEIVLVARDASGLEAVRRIVLPVGPPAVPTLSPAAVAFEPRAVGTESTPATIRIQNLDRGTLKLGPLALEGADAASFRKVADGCSNATLTPGRSCVVRVRFRPRAEGSLGAALVVRPWSPVQAPVAIDLTGEGQPPPSPSP